jgi:hypothetical protein
MQDC